MLFQISRLRFYTKINDSGNGRASYCMFISTGKTLQTKSLSNIAAGKIIPIELSGYAKGVYMVYLQVDGEASYKKLIVE